LFFSANLVLLPNYDEHMDALPYLRLTDVARHTWDAIVVGAGVAGSVAAYGLAHAGLSVLLVDKATFPRWKVCGACLNPGSLAALDRVGLGELPDRCGAVPVSKMHLAVPGRRAEISLPGWKVLSRERFDAALAEAACEVGAAFLSGACASLNGTDADARALLLRRDNEQESVRTRLVVAADGLGGRLLTGENGCELTPTADSRVGVGVVAEDAPDCYRADVIFMAYGPGGYVGLARREDGRLNIAAALDVARLRASDDPGMAVAQLLNAVGWPALPNLSDLPWRGTPALTRHANRPAAERLLAIGDAAGYVEPFTGEGIGWALASGTAVVPFAAAAIERWHLSVADAWSEWHRHTAPRRQRLCRSIAWLSRHPRLAGAAVSLLSRWPWLAAPLVRSTGAPSRSSGTLAATSEPLLRHQVSR
jgi:flavin-dependent dehydrogenase